MRKKVATMIAASGALLMFATPASSFTVVHPKTGECRQILVPGPATGPSSIASALMPSSGESAS